MEYILMTFFYFQFRISGNFQRFRQQTIDYIETFDTVCKVSDFWSKFFK